MKCTWAPRFITAGLILAVTSIAPNLANASPISVFTLTDSVNDLITFQIPLNPVQQPDQKTDTSCPYVASSAFCMSTLVTINGVDNYDTVEMFGWNSSSVGDLLIMPAFQKTKYTVFQAGPVLFSGNSTYPAFWPNSTPFNLTNKSARNPTYNQNFTLTISQYVDPPAATPEPSSLMLLGTGLLGLAGFAHRKYLHA